MPESSSPPLSAHTMPNQRQARLIRRLREALFELQCAVEPDPAAIDRLMRRLARVRSRDGHGAAHA